MKKSLARGFALAASLLAAPVAAGAASTPKPVPIPTPNLPNHPLHDTIEVEVNNRGQVVRIKGGQLSHDAVFDTMAIGNALQMWIRRADQTAVVGVYRVTYDYDPHTHNVARHVALVSKGGNWAHQPGAATRMIDAATRETREAYARMKAAEKRRKTESAKHLPDINAAVKRAIAKPTPTSHP